MIHEIHFSRRANANLKRLDEPTRWRILDRLDEIAADPYGRETKALTGPRGLRSSRVGDYRIVFLVNDAQQAVGVTVIGPRGQVYRGI